jgi:hypothetical protein
MSQHPERIAGPFAILVVPEASFRIDRSGPIPVAVPTDGSLPFVALGTFEQPDKHAQQSATFRAVSAEDQDELIFRLRKLAEFVQRKGAPVIPPGSVPVG